MAGANEGNGLDLEQLLAGAMEKTKLVPTAFDAFAEQVRKAYGKHEAFNSALEVFLKGRMAQISKEAGTAKRADIDHGSLSYTMGLPADAAIGHLIGEEGLIARYEALFSAVERHDDVAIWGIVHSLIRTYSRKMASLEGSTFYPPEIATAEISSSGESSREEHARAVARREAFISFSKRMEQQGVDYRLRKLLGENYERRLALEEQLSGFGTTPTVSGVSEPAVQDSTASGSLPLVEPPKPLPLLMPVPKGTEMWTGVIKYDSEHRRLSGQMMEFVTTYLQYLSQQRPELGMDETAQRDNTILLSKLVGMPCEKYGLTEVMCKVYVTENGVFPYVGRMPEDKG